MNVCLLCSMFFCGHVQYWECKNLDKEWEKASESVKFRNDQYIRISTDSDVFTSVCSFADLAIACLQSIRARKGNANLCMRRLKKCIVIGGTDPDPPASNGVRSLDCVT